MINKKPTRKEIAINDQKKLGDWFKHKKYVRIIIEIKINKFNICCPGKVIGDPDINPLNFRKAIIEPEKVIAPTAAPIDISIRLASLIFPEVPKLKTSGLIKADIATNTAAKPTKLWKPATNSGIAVIGILNAMKAPIEPPISKKSIT